MTSKSSQKSGSHTSGEYQYSMSLGVNQHFKDFSLKNNHCLKNITQKFSHVEKAWQMKINF
jgi:hypothetical protein